MLSFFYFSRYIPRRCLCSQDGRGGKGEKGRGVARTQAGRPWAQLEAQAPRSHMFALPQHAHDGSSDHGSLARKSKRQPGGNLKIGPAMVAGHFAKKLEKVAVFGPLRCVDRGCAPKLPSWVPETPMRVGGSRRGMASILRLPIPGHRAC